VRPWALSGAAAAEVPNNRNNVKERADEKDACCSLGGDLLSLNHNACNTYGNRRDIAWEASGTWCGWAGTMLRDPPPSKDELSCTQQRAAPRTHLRS
jgi:hypothetical protein